MKSTYQGLKYNIRFLLESRKDKNSGEKIVVNVPIIMAVTFNNERLFLNIGFRTNVSLWEEGELYAYQRKNTFNNDGISASTVNATIT